MASKNHGIKTHNGYWNDEGPSAPALTRFLNNTGKGKMAGGDSASYYWGNMLLEKLRIWKGDKKTPARLRAEKE
jgi:hypothetical protein